ncbi:MDR family MFS transporter [Gorillibacterium sp. sgz500922]|uniref:MDR family MFS transporter n=1 Tax=Gorillibacterium sp. sgz500922 TaxID=3446694 RepID=UPI003F67E230
MSHAPLQAEGAPQAVPAFSVRAILPVLLTLIVGMLVVMLDSTIMNVAVPRLEETFHVSLKIIQWAITAYTLALSVVIPLSGWFSDRFTAKRVFLVSIGLFVVGSLLCSASQTAAQLILFRIVQGIGGGMVFPIGMAISFKLAPPDKRGSIMGILGLPMLIAPVLGPALSGFLLEYVNWHWIFLINLPIGLAAVLLGLRFLPSGGNGGGTSRLDVPGMLLSPLAFATLVFAVHRAGTDGLGSYGTLGLLAVSLAALVAFVLVEIRQKEPLLALQAFRSREFTKGMILTWFNQIAMFGTILLIPLYLQQVRGFSTFHSGLLVIPQALASFLGMMAGGKWLDKRGTRPVVFTGLCVLSTAILLLSGLRADTPEAAIIGFLILLGLGQGLTTMQVGTHVLKAAPKEWISRVTPLTSSSQQIVNSFAVAIVSGFLTNRIAEHATGSANPLQAMVGGFHDTFLLTLALALCGLLLSLLLRKQPN